MRIRILGASVQKHLHQDAISQTIPFGNLRLAELPPVWFPRAVGSAEFWDSIATGILHRVGPEDNWSDAIEPMTCQSAMRLGMPNKSISRSRRWCSECLGLQADQDWVCCDLCDRSNGDPRCPNHLQAPLQYWVGYRAWCLWLKGSQSSRLRTGLLPRATGRCEKEV